METSRELQPLSVTIGERRYAIHFGTEAERALFDQLEALRRERSHFGVITDSNIARSQAALLERFGCETLVLPPGEPTKSAASLERAWNWMSSIQLDRGGAVFAFGGGVIGDLAGFAAATYLRGIRCFQVPTTLLAMVDSSVGGKTGINTQFGKNLIGAFWQPSGVYALIGTLRTLDAREFAAGMAEVVKTGLLADRELFDSLAASPDPLAPDSADLPAVIRRCCEIKAQIVSEDEKETAPESGRALLNLGHTFAHAIENVAGYGTYLHGEAVAIGLVLACRLSEETGLLADPAAPAVAALLRRYHLPCKLHAPLPVAALMDAMRRDKKARGGRLRLVGLQAVGRAVTVDRVPESALLQLWRECGAEG